MQQKLGLRVGLSQREGCLLQLVWCELGRGGQDTVGELRNAHPASRGRARLHTQSGQCATDGISCAFCVYTKRVSTVAESTRASDRAYASLLHEIQTGHLEPGAVVAEVEQSARLGISRTPVREAIQRLVADGLLVQNSPRITTVASIGLDDIRALFEVRGALEVAAARAAAERGDSETFGRIASWFGSIERIGRVDIDEYYRVIADFDREIDEAAGNAYLAAALRPVRTHLGRVRRLAGDNPARLEASIAEHRQIATAISRGNADLAAHATHIHLHNALAAIEESLGEDASDSPRERSA